MSGGVDSTVAALLMKSAGEVILYHEATTIFFMRTIQQINAGVQTVTALLHSARPLGERCFHAQLG